MGCGSGPGLSGSCPQHIVLVAALPCPQVADEVQVLPVQGLDLIRERAPTRVVVCGDDKARSLPHLLDGCAEQESTKNRALGPRKMEHDQSVF
jgi:hypothetical protein